MAHQFCTPNRTMTRSANQRERCINRIGTHSPGTMLPLHSHFRCVSNSQVGFLKGLQYTGPSIYCAMCKNESDNAIGLQHSSHFTQSPRQSICVVRSCGCRTTM